MLIFHIYYTSTEIQKRCESVVKMVEKELIDVRKEEVAKEAAEKAQKLAAAQNPSPSGFDAPAAAPTTVLTIADAAIAAAPAHVTATTTELAANMAEAALAATMAEAVASQNR